MVGLFEWLSLEDMVRGEPVLITNVAGIVLVLVCCASVSFMVWFYIAVSRESRKHSGPSRLRLIVKTSHLEPIEELECSVPRYLATSIRMPSRAVCSQAANRRAIDAATAGRRTGRERPISR